MDLAWISVAALLVTVLVSCTSRINPGVLAITLAWGIALISPLVDRTAALTVKLVLSGFPSDLFLTLTGVTLFFAQAQSNGTLDKIAHSTVVLCRGHAGMVPLAFFLLAATLSAAGAGSVATAAVIAPMAMAAAGRLQIPAFLMAIMVGHGAVAGGMSPFAVTGLIANKLMERMELGGHEGLTFFYNFAANALVAWTGYIAFGGWRLFQPSANSPEVVTATFSAGDIAALQNRDVRFQPQHFVTIAAIIVLTVAVLKFEVHIGLAAFAVAALLTLARVADEKDSLRNVPWGVILMVCGVTVLTAVLERTGGVERISGMIAAISTPQTLPAVLSLATSVISVYSSTSGVVLPAFLPAVPGLVEQVGGGDPIALASAINIGGNLVDVSPLSTIGALCIACAAAAEDRQKLFNKMLLWGLSMSLIAPLLCTLFFGLR